MRTDRWGTPQLDWRDLEERQHGCYLRRADGPCPAFAAVLMDSVPYCLDCADLVLERLCVEQPYRVHLPSLVDR